MKKTFALLCAAAVTVTTLGVSLPATAASRQSQFGPAAHHRVPFEAHGNYAYYNGHRGDRHFHRGWRQYNGYWFPPAAFIGAAIGGAILGGMMLVR